MKRAKPPASDCDTSQSNPTEPALNPTAFRRRLMSWYRLNARPLPWRATTDPYRIWVSEIMLQQTRVAAVLEHYAEFLRRFPSLISLALAPEADVLAAWSGLGYYRRARMLHKAAQFIMLERDGHLPTSSIGLRTLPGIGEYTSAAIASIAFGESIAVVDGNVERVLHRLTGRPHDDTAAGRSFIHKQAQTLMPAKYLRAASPESSPATALRDSAWDARERITLAAAAHPDALTGQLDEAEFRALATNAAGDHNQAMMELGATICLPRAPLCLHCPVYALCQTRGEHRMPTRPAQLSRPAAYLLDLRKRGTATEIHLERRPSDASLMPGMYELPPVPIDAVEGHEPVLRIRHSITNTNYYVQIFAPRSHETRALRRAIPTAATDLLWVRTSRLHTLPITGLTRKVLQRLKVMEPARMAQLE